MSEDNSKPTPHEPGDDEETPSAPNLLPLVPLVVSGVALLTGHSIEGSILFAAWYLGEVMRAEWIA